MKTKAKANKTESPDPPEYKLVNKNILQIF